VGTAARNYHIGMAYTIPRRAPRAAVYPKEAWASVAALPPGRHIDDRYIIEAIDVDSGLLTLRWMESSRSADAVFKIPSENELGKEEL